LKLCHPHLNLEDKVLLDGVRDVMDHDEEEGADEYEPNWNKGPRLRAKRNPVRPK